VTKNQERLSKKLGITFNDPQLLFMALTHRSAGGKKKNNERLEFLGDSVLGFVIAQSLYDAFPEAPEGVLSRLRADLVKKEYLAELARKEELGEYLILGSGELKSGGFRRDSILADTLEAIMGAIVKDQGFDRCRQWILKLFSDKLQRLSLENWKKDPKTRLQEHMQARKLDLPEYTLITMTGLPHAQTFQVECRVAMLRETCIGSGLSRKRAEQDAAEQMLKKLHLDLS
jgi:ribonuclease-3